MNAEPFETVSLGGASLTLHTLECVLDVARKHGKVLIVAIGPTSVFQLAAEFQSLAEKVSDAMTKPGGNKTLPRCEVPDCVNQASFIINERALCFKHKGRSDSCALPPSLRKRS